MFVSPLFTILIDLWYFLRNVAQNKIKLDVKFLLPLFGTKLDFYNEAAPVTAEFRLEPDQYHTANLREVEMFVRAFVRWMSDNPSPLFSPLPPRLYTDIYIFEIFYLFYSYLFNDFHQL